jgi:ubiquinol-cytochrome c reductase cytochrome b subunit
MMIKYVARWMDSRLGLGKFVRKAMNHVFPDHWSFLFGEIALYAFVVLVITGIYLMMFFNGSSAEVYYHGPYHPLDGVKMTAAYRSALHLSFGVPAGLLVRQMHHWAALIFLSAIMIHAARIFFTGAYRNPREINWIVGLTLMVLAIVNGYLGYSMIGDLLSGVGLRIGYAIALSIPIFGPWVAFLFFGGTIPSPSTIPRLYALHIFLVPSLIAALIGIHLAIIWRQKHTNYPGPMRTDRTIVGSRLYPSYAAKSVGLFFLVMAVCALLGGLVQIDPIWVYGPFNPAAVIPGAQPDWYLGWIEGSMRLFPGFNIEIGHRVIVPELFLPAVLMPALLFLGLYAYPFLEKLFLKKDEAHNVLLLPYQRPFNAGLGSAVLMYVVVLLFAGGDDVIALETDTSVVTIRFFLRILVFLAPLVTGMVVYAVCARLHRKRTALEAAGSPDRLEAKVKAVKEVEAIQQER